MSDGEPPVNTGRKSDGRFSPGHKGGPGKPKGARHRSTLMAEKIFSNDLKAVAETTVREAKNGQSWACKLVIERILPPARDRPTPFKLPPIASPADLPPVAVSLIEAVASGELTPGEGDALLGMLDKLRAAFESADLAQEIADMRIEIETLRARVEGAAA